jgi:hypothetical protein
VDYFQKAKEIYQQIGDASGVSKCDARIAEVEGILSKQETTSTAPTVQEVTSSTIPNSGPGLSAPIYAVFGLIILILLAYALNLGRKMKKEGKEHGSGSEKQAQ